MSSIENSTSNTQEEIREDVSNTTDEVKSVDATVQHEENHDDLDDLDDLDFDLEDVEDKIAPLAL
ncbi:ammosamide/lymphostin RiPP family protein [Pseudovibrio sp. SPO723]|uniref:ammosamide/lymphostin RiPP family protein n=1 Tax=Nesiotobacter zosterae TaxID=392721 RepID=UPI0029C1DCE7|nr:ammosamide/lymphostin RiPP family protein [Pseudovibrio sp. SPO723]MDX5594268.1 ammosamide/lymphostin RiPP family protein [Pseudovibrio sp. SPO723]